MERGTLLYLTYDDVQEILDVDSTIRIAEEALQEHANDRVDWCEPRQMVLRPTDYPDTAVKYKSCVLRGIGIAGSRIVGLNRTEFGKSVAAQRPTKLILLTDPASGAFLAILDEHGSYALRTGAGVAIAIRYLANPDCQTFGMVGSGDMAEATLVAIRAVVSPVEVRVWSRSPQNRERFAERMRRQLGMRVVPVSTCEQAVRDCQIVVSATTARDPYIKDEWLDAGSTFYTKGEHQEAETPVYLNTDKFVVDDWEQVKIKTDMKDLMAQGLVSEKSVYADFSDLVSGKKPGRERADERILVRSQGLVTQDIAIANWVYHQALERGIGQTIRT
jgi:ornithine cyclodeaminase/alanine dehydrogenase-like protein (mu-crystallin family)